MMELKAKGKEANDKEVEEQKRKLEKEIRAQMLKKLTEMTQKINKKMKTASLEANKQEKAGRLDVGRDKSPRRVRINSSDESVDLDSKEDTGESRAQKTSGKAQKSHRETKDEKKDRIAKLREKNNDAKLKSQPTTKKAATQELESRCTKIEDFLQDRFNWLNYEKQAPKKKSEPVPARNDKKPDRFNYMVDMTEKPQDPGTYNELCMEREQKAKARALKAIKNPTTVCQLEKYTELNSNPVKLVPLSTLEMAR